MRTSAGHRIAIAASALLSLACSPEHEIIEDCRDANGIHVICGLQNPEDLALLSDGQTLVVSQFGGMEGERPGNLALLDLGREAVRVAHYGHAAASPPGGAAPTAPTRAAGWGDPSCPGPPPEGFAPHGIDLAPRPDGKLRLLVVNHGGRESVEMFEVLDAGPATQIVWRGCAIPPEGSFLNDVVSLPGGGFLVTHMMDPESQVTDMLLTLFGVATGHVYAWQPDGGFSVVAGTEGAFPNGIEVSEDGAEIYLNLYLGNAVWRVSRKTGEKLAVGDVRQPDNSTWAADGRLLVASHLAGLPDSAACAGLTSGACPFRFQIVALDPETLESEVIFENAGPPMGAATVALEVGDELVLGSFAGDRVIRTRRQSAN